MSQRKALQELRFSWENGYKSSHCFHCFFCLLLLFYLGGAKGGIMVYRGFHQHVFQQPDWEAGLILFSLGGPRAEFPILQLSALGSKLKRNFTINIEKVEK